MASRQYSDVCNDGLVLLNTRGEELIGEEILNFEILNFAENFWGFIWG